MKFNIIANGNIQNNQVVHENITKTMAQKKKKKTLSNTKLVKSIIYSKLASNE